MKFFKINLLLLLISVNSICQNLPACDSLVIDCCTYNTAGPNTVSLTVTNYSSVLFDYPSFVLFNNNMDTIAIEAVNYFGIGNNPQIHTMTLVAPLNLPFTGFLNLYTLFFASQACSFPITLPDTVTGISFVKTADNNLVVFPNPVTGNNKITLKTGYNGIGSAVISLTDMQGRMIRKEQLTVVASENIKMDSGNLKPGIYHIQLELGGQYYSCKFLKQ